MSRRGAGLEVEAVELVASFGGVEVAGLAELVEVCELD